MMGEEEVGYHVLLIRLGDGRAVTLVLTDDQYELVKESVQKVMKEYPGLTKQEALTKAIVEFELTEVGPSDRKTE